MSNRTRTPAPQETENKALAPQETSQAPEPQAPEPASGGPLLTPEAGTVAVTLAHFYETYRPGQTIHVTPQVAGALREAGYVARQ